MKAKYIMTHDVIVARPDMPIDEAKARMDERHISGLPVVDDEGRVVGIISQTDISEKHGEFVKDIMASPVITVGEDALIEEVAALMAINDVNRIPVVQDGYLVGIVARGDIVRYVATRPAWPETTGMGSQEASHG